MGGRSARTASRVPRGGKLPRRGVVGALGSYRPPARGGPNCGARAARRPTRGGNDDQETRHLGRARRARNGDRRDVRRERAGSPAAEGQARRQGRDDRAGRPDADLVRVRRQDDLRRRRRQRRRAEARRRGAGAPERRHLRHPRRRRDARAEHPACGLRPCVARADALCDRGQPADRLQRLERRDVRALEDDLHRAEELPRAQRAHLRPRRTHLRRRHERVGPHEVEQAVRVRRAVAEAEREGRQGLREGPAPAVAARVRRGRRRPVHHRPRSGRRREEPEGLHRPRARRRRLRLSDLQLGEPAALPQVRAAVQVLLAAHGPDGHRGDRQDALRRSVRRPGRAGEEP